MLTELIKTEGWRCEQERINTNCEMFISTVLSPISLNLLVYDAMRRERMELPKSYLLHQIPGFQLEEAEQQKLKAFPDY